MSWIQKIINWYKLPVKKTVEKIPINIISYKSGFGFTDFTSELPLNPNTYKKLDNIPGVTNILVKRLYSFTIFVGGEASQEKVIEKVKKVLYDLK